MDTDGIKSILNKDSACASLFRGVFARDTFLNIRHKSGIFVLNTDYSNQPGTHWLSVTIYPDKIEYFDSYAFPPHVYPDVYNKLLSYADRKKCPLVWNKAPLQGLFSTVCGDYCVMFCLLSARGWTMQDFTKRMELIPNSESRDHLIRSLTIELFNPVYAFNLDGIDGVHIPNSGLQ